MPANDWAVARHGARFAQGCGLLLLSGFHEPSAGQSVGINKGVWESLDAGDRRIIKSVAAGEYARSLAEFNANNALSLRKLRDEGAIKILKFDDALLKAFLEISMDVVAEMARAMNSPGKFMRAISSSARPSWIGATSPNAPSSTRARLRDGSNAAMRRRDILAGAGSLATAAGSTFAAPAIAQGLRGLKMVTDWPEGSPGLQSSAVRLAQAMELRPAGASILRYFHRAHWCARSKPSMRWGLA